MEEALKSWVRGQTPDYCAPFNKFSSRDLGVQSICLRATARACQLQRAGVRGGGKGETGEGRLAGSLQVINRGIFRNLDPVTAG